MSAQRLTDAQISAALRAHLPAHARSDVRGRITAEVATVHQARPLPVVLGRLTDADPEARRRWMLLAAAALLVVGVAVAAAVGTLLRQNEPIRQLTVDPAVDPLGFVEQAYAAHRHLPAMTVIARMWDDEEGTPVDVQRFVLDGKGSIRHECCGGAIEIQTPNGTLFAQDMGTGELTWTAGPVPDAVAEYQLVSYSNFNGPACDIGWRYVGPATVVGRSAHHLACPREREGDVALPDYEIWIDPELGIALRTRTSSIRMDENNEPAGVYGMNMEVVSVAPGQPADAEFRPPPGVRVYTAAELQCRDDPEGCQSPAPPQTARPVATPEPGGFVLFPPDVNDLVADTLANYAGLPAMTLRVDDRVVFQSEMQVSTDGLGALRLESVPDEPGSAPVVHLMNGDGFFESNHDRDGSEWWNRLGDSRELAATTFTLGLTETCADGFRYIGLDRLLGRDAWHIACGRDEYWIDRERLLVVRSARNPDPLHLKVESRTVLSIEIGPQPPELFELPDGADVRDGRR
jgi:hypothetical protein